MELGTNIKILRAKRNMSQKTLAKEVGITHNYLSMIENNAKTPSLSLVEKLAKILQAPMAVLFSEIKF